MANIIRFRKRPIFFAAVVIMFLVFGIQHYYRTSKLAPDLGKRTDKSAWQEFINEPEMKDHLQKVGHLPKGNEDLIVWPDLNGPFDPSAPGEGGVAVVTKPEEEMLKNKAYAEYGFNQFVSDKISLHRSLKDSRSPL